MSVGSCFITATGIVCMAATALGDPVKLWSTTNTGSGENIYYGGAVRDHVFYTGQIKNGPFAVNRSGQIVHTLGPSNAWSKCSLPIGNYIFFGGDNGQGIYRVDADWTTDPTGPVNPGGTSPEAFATDGTYLYANDDTDQGVLHKYAIDNPVGSFTLTEVLAATTGLTRIRGFSHHKGKLYAADASGTQVVEVDTTTGSVSNLFTLPGSSYQVVRSGDRMFAIGSTYLRVYDTDGAGNWTSVGDYSLGATPYGLSDVDDGNVWINTSGRNITFWSLRTLPFTDDFESYPAGQDTADLAYNGWNGTPGNTIVASAGLNGSQAAQLTDNAVLTNTISPSVSISKAWTDLYVKPVRIETGPPEIGEDQSVALYFDADGYATAYDFDAAAWVTLSNAVATGAAVTPLADDAFARVSIHKDYTAGRAAVFIDNLLVCEGLHMGGGATHYETLAVQNLGASTTVVDQVWISTNTPAGLGGDSDNDGWADADEIQAWGSIAAATNLVPFTWMADHALEDPDGNADEDALSNRDEYLAGTDPNQASSVFQIVDIQAAGEDRVLTIMGNDSGAATAFVIQRCTNLAEGFVDYDVVPRAAAPANTVYTDTAAPATGSIFYRVIAVW